MRQCDDGGRACAKLKTPLGPATSRADPEVAAYFVDAEAWDLHLLETAPAVDQGSSDLAPTHDGDGIPRPQGLGIDLGAFEWHEPGVQPEGGSGGSATGGGNSGGFGGSGASGGSPATGGATAADEPDESGGCGCRTAPRNGDATALVLAALAFCARTRRRRLQQGA